MSIQVGQKAPEFNLPALVNGEIQNLKHTDYHGHWVVLFFYPADFTFVCPTEITEFAAKKEAFEKLNAVVLGCSTDSAYCHLAWSKTSAIETLNYPLLADQSHEFCRNYGVLLEERGIALRGCFIVDPEGKVRYQVVHDLSVGRSADEILRVLAALQIGELCPASWRPGLKTLGK